KKLHFVSLGKYAKSVKKPRKRKQPKIAVIYALGSIESGEGDEETIGSDRIAAAIRKARKDSTVKAVVMRVNSPGGSALASDVIWREVVLCKKEKPFIVSMGDVAASGGYYISCAADKIFADPTTVTGSIGVFGLIPNTQNFFKNKLGVNFDRVTTNAHSDMMTIFRPLDNFEKRKIQMSVENVYNTFLTRVAEGRGMTKEEVDNIGQGRVWSGIDAKEIGLIDDFGSLNDAIAYAAEKAELEDFKIYELPKQEDPFEKFLKDLTEDLEAVVYSSVIGKENWNTIESIENLKEKDRIQARLPFGFAVKY
ncbi:MAG: signal peptide peptidase SppA, partial [Bacteroidetes bacterium]